MEIKISAKIVKNVLLFITWILFIGLCVQAGNFLCNAIFAVALNSTENSQFWKVTDLSALFQYNETYFITQTSLMVIVVVMKAILFYLILKLLLNKSFDFSKPFNEDFKKFISMTGYLTLGLGIFSNWGSNYAASIKNSGVAMPTLESMELAGADVWIFMSVTLFVIAYIVKKGIEIQTENDLTI